MSEKPFNFVMSKTGAVYRRTEMNAKSKSMNAISDQEALKYFLDKGYNRTQLAALGLAKLYDAASKQANSKNTSSSE